MKIKGSNYYIPPVAPGQRPMMDLRRQNRDQQNQQQKPQNQSNGQSFQQILDQEMKKK